MLGDLLCWSVCAGNTSHDGSELLTRMINTLPYVTKINITNNPRVGLNCRQDPKLSPNSYQKKRNLFKMTFIL